MISIPCKILRPLVVICTLLLMLVLIAYFWGYGLLSGDAIGRLLLSYTILVLGSFVIFYVENPDSVRWRRPKV